MSASSNKSQTAASKKLLIAKNKKKKLLFDMWCLINDVYLDMYITIYLWLQIQTGLLQQVLCIIVL